MLSGTGNKDPYSSCWLYAITPLILATLTVNIAIPTCTTVLQTQEPAHQDRAAFQAEKTQ